MAAINQRVPFVIESTGRGEREMDIFSRLLKDRIIFITGGIDDETANVVVAQLLFLSNEDTKVDVHLYVNTPGGSVTAGLAIYDTMLFVKPDVATYCVGQAASMGAVLLTAGTAGKRYALPHSRVMLHQPWGGITGQASEVYIQAQEILRLKSKLNDILTIHTSKKLEQIEEDTDREFFMTAEDALEYGIVDKVITSGKENNKSG